MEKIYYSISEVASLIEEPQSKLRFWESQFDVLSPKRSSKGTRYYTMADINTIRAIQHLLYEQKMTIDGANQRLKTNKNAIERKQEIAEKLTRVRQELSAIRKELNQTEALAEQIVIE